jgi:acetyltransferase-like isoleucine patch superfamily enzyme
MDKIKNLKKIVKALIKCNWYKTLYINFKTQKIKNAIKFPIIVYGKLKIYSFEGDINISHPISSGMIHIGKDLDHNPVSLNPIKFTIDGILKFNGPALISGGSTITIWGGITELGKNVAIGSGVQLKCVDKIIIGDYTRIISLCVVMDTNVHFIKDITTGTIKRSNAPVKIGNNCWINSSSIITKGTIIPDYCISAQNTFLNKDYSKFCNSHTFFAGSPAKPIRENIQRIFDYKEENRLKSLFNNNESLDELIEADGVFKEPNKLPNLFEI